MRPDLFIHTLNILRYGEAQTEASEALAECVDRARDTGKAATLTITLKITPKGSCGQFLIQDQIKTKLPDLEKEETIMFGTPEGNLQREDPRQSKLPLRQVDEPKTQLKNVE